MARIKIPGPIKNDVGGLSYVEVAGATVGEAVRDLVAKYPKLQGKILDAEGNIRRVINVFVRNEDIRHLEQLQTAVDADTEIALIPAISGG